MRKKEERNLTNFEFLILNFELRKKKTTTNFHELRRINTNLRKEREEM